MPAAAEALVERALRLDHADDRRDRLHHGEREPLQRRRRRRRGPTRAAAPRAGRCRRRSARAPRSRGPGGCRTASSGLLGVGGGSGRGARAARRRATVVGSWSSAVPTCTATRAGVEVGVGRARGRARRRTRWSGRRAAPGAPRRRSAARPGRWRGRSGRRRARRGTRRARRCRRRSRWRRPRGRSGRPRRSGRRRGAAWPGPAGRRGTRGARPRPRWPSGRARAPRTGPAPTSSGAPTLTSSPATPGARLRRRARSAYSPIVAPAIDTWTRAPARTSHGSSVARKCSRPGLGRPTALTSPPGTSTTRGPGPPLRASRVIERVTRSRPASPSGPAYGSSSRPVPPHPAATITGPGRCALIAPAQGVRQRVPLDPVAPDDGTLGAGPDDALHAVLAHDGQGAAVAEAGAARGRRLDRDLAPRPRTLGGACRAAEHGVRAGRVDDVGVAAADEVVDVVGDRAALADGAVGGEDGDRPGRAPRLQGREQARLVGRGDDERDRAPALAEPLGEREERRRGVALADEQARHGVLGQGERAPERTGDRDPRADRLRGEPLGAAPPHLDDDVERRDRTRWTPGPGAPTGPGGPRARRR